MDIAYVIVLYSVIFTYLTKFSCQVVPLAIKEKPKLKVYLGRVVRTEYPRTCVVQVRDHVTWCDVIRDVV